MRWEIELFPPALASLATTRIGPPGMGFFVGEDSLTIAAQYFSRIDHFEGQRITNHNGIG